MDRESKKLLKLCIKVMKHAKKLVLDGDKASLGDEDDLIQELNVVLNEIQHALEMSKRYGPGKYASERKKLELENEN
jgi:hypothetical protein